MPDATFRWVFERPISGHWPGSPGRNPEALPFVPMDSPPVSPVSDFSGEYLAHGAFQLQHSPCTPGIPPAPSLDTAVADLLEIDLLRGQSYPTHCGVADADLQRSPDANARYLMFLAPVVRHSPVGQRRSYPLRNRGPVGEGLHGTLTPGIHDGPTLSFKFRTG